MEQLFLSMERHFTLFWPQTLRYSCQVAKYRHPTKPKTISRKQRYWGHQQDPESVHEIDIQNQCHHTTMALTSIHKSFKIAWDLHQEDGLGLFQVSQFCLFHRNFVSHVQELRKSSLLIKNIIAPLLPETAWARFCGFARRSLRILTYLQIQLTWTNNASLFYMSSFTSDVHRWILELHDNRRRPSSGLNSEHLPLQFSCSLHQVEGNPRPLRTGALNQMFQFPVHCTFRFFLAAFQLHDPSRHKGMASYL